MTTADGGRRAESGFTLVELLVVVAIIGIVAGALTESIIIGLRTTTATEAQVSGSFDRQRLAVAFVPDVQSAKSMRLGLVGLDLDETKCKADVSAPVITLARKDRGVTKIVMYYVATTSADPPERQLRRRYCEGESPSTEKVVADDLSEVMPVECSAEVPPTTPSTITGATTTAPRGCTLTVKDAKGVEYRVSASRRAS